MLERTLFLHNCYSLNENFLVFIVVIEFSFSCQRILVFGKREIMPIYTSICHMLKCLLLNVHINLHLRLGIKRWRLRSATANPLSPSSFQSFPFFDVWDSLLIVICLIQAWVHRQINIIYIYTHVRAREFYYHRYIGIFWNKVIKYIEIVIIVYWMRIAFLKK